MLPRSPRQRAQKPFKSPRGQLPESLSVEKLNYDKYREIRFNRDQALWRKEALPFWVEFFHPGYIYQEPVQMHEFTSEGYAQPIRFAPGFLRLLAGARRSREHPQPMPVTPGSSCSTL